MPCKGLSSCSQTVIFEVRSSPWISLRWGTSDELAHDPLKRNGDVLWGLKFEYGYGLANGYAEMSTPGIAFAEGGAGDKAPLVLRQLVQQASESLS